MKGKCLLATITALAVFASSYAQTDFGFKKASKLIEGSLYISSIKDALEDSHAVNINTKVGYFLSEKIAVGPSIFLLNSREQLEEVAKVRVVGAGAFGRYYFLKLGKRLYTYLEGNALYEQIQEANIRNGHSIKEPRTTAFLLSGDFGANLFVNRCLSLNFSLGDFIFYFHGDSKDLSNGGEEIATWNVNRILNGFSASSVGLTYTF